MGQRRRATRHEDDVINGAFPIKFLLPVPTDYHQNDGSTRGDLTPESALTQYEVWDKYGAEPKDSLDLYRQAVPLLHPQSTSAARTIGKIMGNRQLTQRILQRNQMNGITTDETSTAANDHCTQHVEFNRICEDMFRSFDPCTEQMGELPLARVKLLLRHFRLNVDEVAYRRWEQSLPHGTRGISLLWFTQACKQWFPEQAFIRQYAQWQHDARVAREQLGKCQSAPQLHPFDAMVRQQDAALAFSYEAHVMKDPSFRKTTQERNTCKSEAILHASHQLRREVKTLRSMEPCPSSLTSTTTSADGSTVPRHKMKGPVHDRLHREKLAKHLLQRCSTQPLASTYRGTRSTTSLGLGTDQLTQSELNAAHQSRQRASKQVNMEAARLFSTSVAMISRHVHNEELRDQRDHQYEKQTALIDERKQLRRVQRAHCQSKAQDRATQQMREVHAMKAMAQEEAAAVRTFCRAREEALRCQKQPFELSASTSTLVQPPPEILAAAATAKTARQRRQLAVMQKEHKNHVRSLQLLDYVYDKRRAVLDAQRPRAEAALVEMDADRQNVHGDGEEVHVATDELWRLVLDQCEAANDFSMLVPPPNSPPAAMRYFGQSRPPSLPPFVASTATPSAVSKVP